MICTKCGRKHHKVVTQCQGCGSHQFYQPVMEKKEETPSSPEITTSSVALEEAESFLGQSFLAFVLSVGGFVLFCLITSKL